MENLTFIEDIVFVIWDWDWIEKEFDWKTQEVKYRLKTEPTDPTDSQAIAFESVGQVHIRPLDMW